VSKADKTIKQLQAEIGTDLSKFVSNYVTTLRSTTPIATGKARAGWVNTFTGGSIGNGGNMKIARNHVPYIGVLDTGTSRQAPKGIVLPALQKTRKK